MRWNQWTYMLSSGHSGIKASRHPCTQPAFVEAGKSRWAGGQVAVAPQPAPSRGQASPLRIAQHARGPKASLPTADNNRTSAPRIAGRLVVDE